MLKHMYEVAQPHTMSSMWYVLGENQKEAMWQHEMETQKRWASEHDSRYVHNTHSDV